MYVYEFYCVVQNKEIKFLEKFGKRLKQIRLSKGFTQAELANDLGIEISQVSRIERGIINTSIGNINAIANVLGVELRELFDFDVNTDDVEELGFLD